MNTGLQAIGKLVHPNHITASRVPVTIAAIGLDQLSQVASTTAYAVAALLDWLDGAVARSTKGKETREGTLLDPLMDKTSNFLALSYQIGMHIDDIAFMTAALTSMLLNTLSQWQRGPVLDQLADAKKGILEPGACEPVEAEKNVARIKANTFGKVKQIIECLSIGTMFAAGDSQEARIAAAIGLGISSLLCLVSTLKRYWKT